MKDDRIILQLSFLAGFLVLALPEWSLGANPAVSIASFEDKTVVQRDSGMGSFDVTGAYSGTPSGIQARVVDSTGLREIRPWKSVTMVAATKKWNVLLDGIPQGGWYRVEARYQGQTTTPTRSTSRFGVGIIIVMAGQSNMLAFCKEYAPAGGKTIKAHPLTSFATYGWWHWRIPGPRAGKGIGVVLMANNIARALKLPVGVINCAAGSAFIREYLGEVKAYKRDLHDSLATALRFAGGDVEMVLWHQGFSDFYNEYYGRPAATPESLKTLVRHHGWNELAQMVGNEKSPNLPYLEKLKLLQAQIGNQINRSDVPFLCGIKGRTLSAGHVENKQVINRINKAPYDWSPARSGQVDCLRWSQMAFVKDLPFVWPLGSSVDLRFKDNAHYQFEEMLVLASRFSQSVLHAVGEVDYSGGGPSFVPESARLVEGGGIFLKVKHEGGNKLVLPFPNEPIEGFMVRRPGSDEALPIKKVSVRQPDGVFIELENQPSGDLLVTYFTGPSPISDIKPGGLANSPPEFVSDTPPGNILYDNAILPEGNNRPGLPVNGTLGCIRVSKTSPPPQITFSNIFRGNSGLLDLAMCPGRSIRFGYSIQKDAYVTLRLFDSQGRLSMNLLEGNRRAGTHWEKRPLGNLASGFYVARLFVNRGASQEARKVFVSK